MSSFRPHLLAYLIRAVLKILLFTCRLRVEGLPSFLEAQSSGPCILMLWHNRLLIAGHVLSRITPKLTYSAFVSKSRDGEILAQFVNSYQNGRTLRVAHNAKEQALKALINELKTKPEVVIITPDGPRGPKYEIKQGIAKAAVAAGAQTVPWTWSASRFWQLNTWDNLIIPKPFSSIQIHFGDPIFATKELEETAVQFKKELDQATQTACNSVSSKSSHWPR